MAERDTKETGALPGVDGEESPSQWKIALEYTMENPTKVAGGVGFLLLCIVIGGLFSLKNIADDKKLTTAYAEARIGFEEPDAQVEALQEIASGDSRWNVEALYMAGETAIEAKTYDKAREAFEAVLAKHGDSEYAPMAADGLAFLDENEGDLESALQGYTQVFEKWDDTLTGRRQLFNIGRVQEELGKLAEAIESYNRQLEVFPDSSVARKSQMALDRLKSANPDLFPEEEIEGEESDSDASGEEAGTADNAAEAPAESEDVAAEAPAESKNDAAEAPAPEVAESAEMNAEGPTPGEPEAAPAEVPESESTDSEPVDAPEPVTPEAPAE